MARRRLGSIIAKPRAVKRCANPRCQAIVTRRNGVVCSACRLAGIAGGAVVFVLFTFIAFVVAAVKP